MKNKINFKLISLILFLIIAGLSYCLFSLVSDSNNNNIAVIETSMGTIKIELYEQEAPITVANFKSYIQEDYYSGLIFHRVIKDFMVQGGGFDINMSQKETKDSIVLESNNGLKNTVGTIAMARTMDPDSATSQFFINVANNSFLDYSSSNPGYAVFGKVVEGMDVVNAIENVETSARGPYKDWPVEDVIINKVYLE